MTSRTIVDTDAASSAVDERPAVVPPGTIVVGMHRSATSLTTSVLVRCGWTLPGPLLASRQSNPRGLFEDRSVHELHLAALADHHAHWDAAARLRVLRRRPLTLDSRKDLVDRFVAQLRAGAPWVWKNPRATLFLDDWARLLPEARVVVCVRSPASVADSLLRRKNRFGVPDNNRFHRFRRAARALSVWHTYNLVAYRFAKNNPARVAVVRIPEDLGALAAATTPSMFEPELLRSAPRWRVRAVAAGAVASQLLYRRLRGLHDPAKLAEVLAGPGDAGR